MEVRSETMNLISGSVGTGRFESEATYVLVDVKNTNDGDLMVSLRGTLVTAEGKKLGTLPPQSLRVPTGGQRTFALVDGEQKLREKAARAEIEVVGAMKVDYDPPMVIEKGNVYRDGNRVVVTGKVVNTVEREGQVIVVAGFYDGDGVPLKRPSTKFVLDGGGERGVQFVGPDGSESAYLFVGDVVY